MKNQFLDLWYFQFWGIGCSKFNFLTIWLKEKHRPKRWAIFWNGFLNSWVFFLVFFCFRDMVDFVFNSGSFERDFCEPDWDANMAQQVRGTYKNGWLRRRRPPNMKKILNSSKSWIHYEGKIENWPYLKN